MQHYFCVVVGHWNWGPPTRDIDQATFSKGRYLLGGCTRLEECLSEFTHIQRVLAGRVTRVELIMAP